MKPEFTIEEVRAFITRNYNSVAARYAKSAMQHYDELEKQRDELLDTLKKIRKCNSLDEFEALIESAIKNAEK